MRRFFANAQNDRVVVRRFFAPLRKTKKEMGAYFATEGTPSFIIPIKTKIGLDPR